MSRTLIVSSPSAEVTLECSPDCVHVFLRIEIAQIRLAACQWNFFDAPAACASRIRTRLWEIHLQQMVRLQKELSELGFSECQRRRVHEYILAGLPGWSHDDDGEV